MLAEAETVDLAPEVALPDMTDAELAAVIINDPDAMVRRRALHVMRLREFSAGIRSALQIVQEAT